MKQSTVVIFVSRPEEVFAVEEILKITPDNQPTVIASTPEAAVKLLECCIDFIDSEKFYPDTAQIKSWQKRLLKLCQTWHLHPKLRHLLAVNSVNSGKACELGIHIYLGEIGHSLLTAENLIKKLRPKKIYVGEGFCESPFRRYQTESFTLEPLAVRLIAAKNGIELVQLEHTGSLTPKIILVLRQLISSLLFDLRHIFSSRQTSPDTDFIFVANHYQLVNLLPTLIAAKDKIKFLATGKATVEIVNRVREKDILFCYFDKFLPFLSRFFDTFKYLYAWFISKSLIRKTFSSVDPLIWKLIEPKLWWYFISEFTETASIIRTADKLLSGNPWALITMATSDHFSRAIALTAISKQIPVVELQHGLYLTDCEYPFRSNDYFLMWGKQQRERLYDGIIYPKKYPLAGYPWFDQYKLTDSLKQKNNKSLTILVLANFPRDLDDDRLSVSGSPLQFMIKVFTAISKLSLTAKVVFRPHPSCQAKWVIPLAKQFKVALDYDDRSAPLIRSITDSDLVIANFTTATVDAMLVGRPIFLYTFHKSLKIQVENFDATKFGAWKVFQTTSELETLIRETNSNKKSTEKMLKAQKEFLRKHVVVKPESATEQIVNFIKNVNK